MSQRPSLSVFLKHDGPAGLVVFLVALPLCLGIAVASGAPPFSGVIAGVVGGVVVARLSKSQVSVSGPAAALAFLVAAAIQTLGSFQAFQAAIVLAGGMQLILGLLRVGAITNYVPSCVIRGMLAAIGLVVVLKQIPHALGRDTDFEGDFGFFEATGENTLTDIANSVVHPNAGAMLIAVASLLVLYYWDKLARRGLRLFSILPGPLMVVLLGIALNYSFGQFAPSLQLIASEHLISLPNPQSTQAFFSQFSAPDFSKFESQPLWVVAFFLATVASLETLLSLEAADRLDPHRRSSPPNRELLAQGFGNMVSGLIGGLPVASVIIRTSANVYAGGLTWVSSFTHGILLFGAAFLIPAILNWTPLACVASILIMVGYRLTAVSIYKEMYAKGLNQFVPFAVTVVAIVFTDLLTGVLVGSGVGLLFVIRANHHEAITVVSQDRYCLMRFNKDATFVNKSELRNKLRKVPENTHLIIDGSRALYIDRDIYDLVEEFEKGATHKQIAIEYKNFDNKVAHPMRR